MAQPTEHVDPGCIDRLIANIDTHISAQLDAVLHHPAFQRLEAAWRGLQFLVDRTDFDAKVQIELLNCSKEDLGRSFAEMPEALPERLGVGLYRHLYTQAYDQPEAAPYTALIANYEFTNASLDVALLQQAAQLAALTQCPFIASVGPVAFSNASEH